MLQNHSKRSSHIQLNHPKTDITRTNEQNQRENCHYKNEPKASVLSTSSNKRVLSIDNPLGYKELKAAA